MDFNTKKQFEKLNEVKQQQIVRKQEHFDYFPFTYGDEVELKRAELKI